jgi:acyl-coenzyme A thioesterase PaaI-like protein
MAAVPGRSHPRTNIVLTSEFAIHLLRPARGEKLECVATVLKPGRMLTVVESEVYCHAGSERVLVAKAVATIANVAKDKLAPT